MAAQLKEPLHKVMEWPQWSVDLMQAFLSREPTAEERCEIGMAQHTAIYVGGKIAKGKPRPKVTDFMMFRTVWERKMDFSRYTPDEIKTMAALGLKIE